MMDVGGLFLDFEAIPSAGAIEVFGQEFSFGGCRRNKCGIFACKPTKCPMHTYRESIYLGDCGKDLAEVQRILVSVQW